MQGRPGRWQQARLQKGIVIKLSDMGLRKEFALYFANTLIVIFNTFFLYI